MHSEIDHMHKHIIISRITPTNKYMAQSSERLEHVIITINHDCLSLTSLNSHETKLEALLRDSRETNCCKAVVCALPRL